MEVIDSGTENNTEQADGLHRGVPGRMGKGRPVAVQ
nr:MAG TPA: hypothetical protein [Caudoviricetes sp.]